MARKIDYIFLYVFSVAIGLGTFNPFAVSTFDIDDATSAGSPILQIIELLFVIYICIRSRLVKQQNKRGKSLWIFVSFFILVSVIGSMALLYVNQIDWRLFSKIIVCTLLCIFLPQYFVLVGKTVMYRSFLIFSFVSVIITTLFMFGIIDSFVSWHKGRAFIFGDNPNSLSTRYVLSFLLLMHIIFDNPLGFSKKRLLATLSFVPLLYAIIATGSRGSFIILITSIIVFVLFSSKWKGITKILVSIVLLPMFFLLVIYIINNNPDFSLFERLSSTIVSNDDGGRGFLNSAAINIFMTYPFGVGADGFKYIMLHNYGEIRTVHNLFLYILATSGIVGFIAFMEFVLKLLLSSIKSRKRFSFSLVLVIFIIATAWKTGGMLIYFVMWYVFAIIITFLDYQSNLSDLDNYTFNEK